MIPEFSRVERLDTIGSEPRPVAIAADADERAALAARFGLIAVAALEGDFTVRREAGGIAVAGEVRARVTQACSVTGDPIPAAVTEPVALLFVAPGPRGEEVELDDAAIDTVELEGGGVDLGETAAETMALALDPFPRSPAAADALRAAGVLSEEEAGAFGALKGLKERLGGA